jgi:photosystem II stability/assembly factor-like uncharacterized protein
MKATLAPNGCNRYEGNGSCAWLLVGTADGLVTLEREGAAAPWAVTTRALHGQHISSLLIEPRRGGIFAGAHSGGLYASLDSGQSWVPRMRGLSPEHVFTLASVECDGRVLLYAGTQPAHLFVSDDYAESWRELPTLRQASDTSRWTFPGPPYEAHVKDITFDPRDSRTVYVGIEQGALLKSTDGGQTWRELASYYGPDNLWYKDIHRLAWAATDPRCLVMTTGDGVYRSKNAGETWEHLTDTNGRIGYPDALLFAPPPESTLYIAGGHTSPDRWRETPDADAAIARSCDVGTTWEILSGGLPRHFWGNVEAMSMAIRPGGYTLFAGTIEGEVFTSDDRGDTWTQIGVGLAPIAKSAHARMADSIRQAKAMAAAS